MGMGSVHSPQKLCGSKSNDVWGYIETQKLKDSETYTCVKTKSTGIFID